MGIIAGPSARAGRARLRGAEQRARLVLRPLGHSGLLLLKQRPRSFRLGLHTHLSLDKLVGTMRVLSVMACLCCPQTSLDLPVYQNNPENPILPRPYQNSGEVWVL